MESIPSCGGKSKLISALLLLMAGAALSGCVNTSRHARDIAEIMRSCDSAIEVLTAICKEEIIKQKKDRGLRF